jgi:hypothetical protein
MTLTSAILHDAQRTIYLTLDDARALPDLLGRICYTHLVWHGFYTATVQGVKTLYIRV